MPGFERLHEPSAGGSNERQETANVVFGDGSVVRLKNDFPPEELRKLLTHQGGEKVVRPK